MDLDQRINSSWFVDYAQRLGRLVAEKNAAYGNSFANTRAFLELLYPDGMKPDDYVYALILARMFDKMMRVANGHLEDSFGDIAGYAFLGEKQARGE